MATRFLKGLGWQRWQWLAALVVLAGCGGEPSESFVDSSYIQIGSGSSLDPISLVSLSGFRIVFLNNDSVPHTITWEAPLTLSATAPANDRAWFDLPLVPSGSVLHYHLDASGPGGTVTILQPPQHR